MRRAAAAAVAAAILVSALAAGCARRDVLTGRLREMPDEAARRVLSDSIWACGDIYRWADHASLRLEVNRIDNTSGAERRGDEVWTLDLAGGRVRIEKPVARQVIVYDGVSWHVFIQGKETQDLETRAEAAGDVAIARGLATLPFGLLDAPAKITYVGTRTGPGEARVWDRLLVAYPPGGGFEPGDRTLVEFNKQSHRADSALIMWSEAPFLGGTYCVKMDEWWMTADLALAHRLRFVPVNDKGAATGPVYWTLEVRSVLFDAPLGPATFSQP